VTAAEALTLGQHAVGDHVGGELECAGADCRKSDRLQLITVCRLQNAADETAKNLLDIVAFTPSSSAGLRPNWARCCMQQWRRVH